MHGRSFRARMAVVTSPTALASILAGIFLYLNRGFAWVDFIALFPASIVIGVHYFYLQRYELSLRTRLIALCVAVSVILGGFVVLASYLR